MPPAKKSADAAASSAPPDDIPNLDLSGLSPKQWLYVQVLQEMLDKRQTPTITACCAIAKVHRSTVWDWWKSPAFLRALARVFRAHVESSPRDAMVDYAVQVQAMAGSPMAIEANLRRRQLWDPGFGDATIGGGPPGSAAGAQATAQIVFMGLPPPPDEATRARLNPPPGSAMILRDGVLMDASLLPTPEKK